MINSTFKIKPIISFCIPTYNRAEKIYKLVSEILLYPEDDIEVIILDNCSTDDTKNKLLTIEDDRFFFYENKINIGGKTNGVKALTFCIGHYILFCLDKDFVNYLYIKTLISFLKSSTDIVLGYCSLNINESTEPIIFEKGIQSIHNMAYLSKHPSGFFFKNDVVQKLNIYEKRNFYYSESGFVFDFISAELSMYGKSAKLNFPLVSTETKEEASISSSHSYSGNNLFFLPEKQYELFNLYKTHIFTLNISKRDKIRLTNRLCLSKFISSTLGFDAICKDKLICLHYGFKPSKTGLFSILSNDILFCRKFILTCNYRSMLLRLGVCIKANLSLLFKIIISN